MIKMTETQGQLYRQFLQAYRDKTGQEPDGLARTEAFICARSNDAWQRPAWCC